MIEGDETGNATRELADVLIRGAPLSEVRALRDALREVYGRRYTECSDAGRQSVETILDAADRALGADDTSITGRPQDHMLGRIPTTCRRVLDDAGFAWIPWRKVYHHAETDAVIAFEELSGDCDVAWLRQRIAQALADGQRTS